MSQPQTRQPASVYIVPPKPGTPTPYAHRPGLSFVPSLRLLRPHFEPHCSSNQPTGDRTPWISSLTPWPSRSRAGCCSPSRKKVRRRSAERESTATTRDADLVPVQDGCTRKACRCSLVSAFCAPLNPPDGLTRSRVFDLDPRVAFGHDNVSYLL